MSISLDQELPDDYWKSFDKLRDADRVLKIQCAKPRGFKKGELQMITSGARGSGKSMLPGGGTIFKTDPRLSAISRDGCKIEINYHSYPASEIPGFLDWMDHHGIAETGYRMDGPHVTFLNLTDADMFWMTFVGISLGRFAKMRGKTFDETAEDARQVQLIAKKAGLPLYLDTDKGRAMIVVNEYRASPLNKGD